MKNLEQIRAHNSLQFASSNSKISGQQGGDVVKKVPALILNHGLLAVLGFAIDERQEGIRSVCDGIAQHLSSKEIAIVPSEVKDTQALLAFLTSKADSRDLQRATSEAMAWLNYTRRFVTK